MTEDVPAAEQVHTYSTAQITVEWRPGRCIHSAQCPSGALRYVRHDGGAQAEPAGPTSVESIPNEAVE